MSPGQHRLPVDARDQTQYSRIPEAAVLWQTTDFPVFIWCGGTRATGLGTSVPAWRPVLGPTDSPFLPPAWFSMAILGLEWSPWRRNYGHRPAACYSSKESVFVFDFASTAQSMRGGEERGKEEKKGGGAERGRERLAQKAAIFAAADSGGCASPDLRPLPPTQHARLPHGAGEGNTLDHVFGKTV